MKNHSDEDISTLPVEYERQLIGRFYHVKIDRGLNVLEVKLFDEEINYFDRQDFIVCELFASDEKEAVKIAKEEAVKLIESGDWDASKKELERMKNEAIRG